MKIKKLSFGIIFFTAFIVILFLFKVEIRQYIEQKEKEKNREAVLRSLPEIRGNKLVIGDSFVRSNLFNCQEYGYEKVGVNGEVIEGVLEYLKHLNLENVDTLLIWIGIGDVLMLNSITAIKADYIQLFEYLNDQNFKYSFIEVPKIAKNKNGFFVKANEVNPIIDQVNSFLSCFLEGSNGSLMCFLPKQNYHHEDGVHLNKYGYEQLMKKIQ